MADKDPWETAAPASAPADKDPWEVTKPKDKSGMSWLDVGKQAVTNIPSSAVELGKNIAQPFLHPIETATSMKNIGEGALQKAGILGGEDKKAYADAVGQFVMDRYGSMENFKKTLATDPVGVLADAAMVLTGGEAALARAPGIVGKTAEVAGKVGRAVDPLTAAGKGIAGAGKVATDIIGLGTGTGGEPLRIAAAAGREGGEAGRQFREEMRGKSSPGQVVDDARRALSEIRRERGAEYRSGMASVAGNKTVLDFDKINDALADITNVQTFHGQVLNPHTQAIREEIGQIVAEWRSLPPDTFHTPEGLDALKKRVGAVREKTQPGTPDRHVADKAYNAVRDTIVQSAPEYAKVMNAYETASDLIDEMERTLSLKETATIDTSLRKLQSVLRNNVSTNYGQRKVLADYLVEHGAPHLLERLAGQSLSSIEPRGLAKVVAQGLAALLPIGEAAGAPGASLGALAALPMMSPRAMGEVSHAAGRASRLVPYPKAAARTAQQEGRIQDYLRRKGMVQ